MICQLRLDHKQLARLHRALEDDLNYYTYRASCGDVVVPFVQMTSSVAEFDRSRDGRRPATPGVYVVTLEVSENAQDGFASPPSGPGCVYPLVPLEKLARVYAAIGLFPAEPDDRFRVVAERPFPSRHPAAA